MAQFLLQFLFFVIYLNTSFWKRGKEKNDTCVALTDSSESVLPLLIPFWKSKAANGTHSRADVPARRRTLPVLDFTSARPIFRDRDERRVERRNETNQRANDDVRVDGTIEQPLRGPLRGRAARVKMTATSQPPERPSAVQGQRRSQLRVAARRCVSVSARSLARSHRALGSARDSETSGERIT